MSIPLYVSKRRRKKKKTTKRGLLLSKIRDISRKVEGEKKFLDNSQTTVAFLLGNFILLNGIGQGTAVNQRVGLKVNFKSMFIRLIGEIDPAISNITLRFLVVYDKQPAGALPTSFDILQFADNVVSPLNVSNSYRFKILCDKSFALNTGGKNNFVWKTYKKLNLYSQYTGAGNTIGDIRTGSFTVYFFSNSAVNPAGVSFTIRMRYIDN